MYTASMDALARFRRSAVLPAAAVALLGACAGEVTADDAARPDAPASDARGALDGRSPLDAPTTADTGGETAVAMDAPVGPPGDVPVAPPDVPGAPVDAAVCTPQCTGRGCGDDGCGGACGTCVAGQSCDATGRCAPPPATCSVHAEVLIYGASGWNLLADAFRDNPTPCGDYDFSIESTGTPAVDPRPGEGPRMRARGARFHALAEFNYGQWGMVTGMTWYQRGVEFRRRMVAAGYDVTQGDGWALNELPSATRTDATVQRNILDAVHGLFDGPAGSPTVRGAVFNYGISQATINVATFKSQLEGWLADAAFWTELNLYVRWFGDEVYASADRTCVPGTTVATRAGYINEYVEHLGVLAAAGPAAVNTAQSYLSRAFVPVGTAVWNSSGPYGVTTIPIDQMTQFVSHQVYAIRTWATAHAYPDGRIGFAWDRQAGVTDTDLAPLATRLAAAIRGAYDEGTASPAHACSPSGAFTFCQCSIAGATYNPAWQSFATWP
jgi:hypothetical protein